MTEPIHFEDCSNYTGGLDIWRGAASGDLMQRYKNCSRISVREPAQPKRGDHVDNVISTKTPPPPVAPRSSFVCRPHYHPVDPRGRGCSTCDADRHRRRGGTRAQQTRRDRLEDLGGIQR